jgi:serine protease
MEATPTYPARIAAFAPNDTGTASRTGAPGGWQQVQWDLVGPFGINAPAAWEAGIAAGAPGGAHVSVAVVDTGVAYADRAVPALARPPRGADAARP